MIDDHWLMIIDHRVKIAEFRLQIHEYDDDAGATALERAYPGN